MKDLFSGSLGRLNNHGGSNIFTTPNTVHVPNEYEISTDVPSVAEFITCSLDGRLWVWKRSRRFYLVALKWDDDSQKLVFAKTTILNNLNIIGRGLDWILSDNMIIQACDDEPYITTANIFADSRNNFLFSPLRSKLLPSGIDPITKNAWGLSDDNGNSEGYGYFNRSALLQSVDKHYSLLPAVGDWNIIGNFLVRRPNNPLSDAHNSMLNIRPLIPLEFNAKNPAYGCGFDNDIRLTYFNGELWGRGLYYFGRCYIIPAVFSEDGTPQEFYLYISPDYLIGPYKSSDSEVTKGEWLDMSIVLTESNLYGFLPEKATSLDNGLCFASDAPKLFDVDANSWLQIADNCSIFIDSLNNSGLVLHDDGAIFLSNKNSYDCKGLRQWLSPAEKVEAVTHDSVISSWDNSTLATHVQQGFYRELLSDKTLPLSAHAHSNKRFSLGEADDGSRKTIRVNSIERTTEAEASTWEKIYKPSLEIKAVNAFDTGSRNCYTAYWPDEDFENFGCLYPVFVTKFKVQATIWVDSQTWQTHFISYNDEKHGTHIEVVNGRYTYGLDSWGGDIYPALSHTCSFEGFYIKPDGYVGHFSGEKVIPNSIPIVTEVGEDYTYVHYAYYGDGADVYGPFDFAVSEEGDIGIMCSHFVNGGRKPNTFVKVGTVPKEILNWQRFPVTGWISSPHPYQGILFLQDIVIPENVPNNIDYSASAVFIEKNSRAHFLCDVPSALSCSNGKFSGVLADQEGVALIKRDSGVQWHVEAKFGERYNERVPDFGNFWNINSLSSDGAFYTECLHVAKVTDEKYEKSIKIVSFKSKVHPEIFDFNAEIERSNLS